MIIEFTGKARTCREKQAQLINKLTEARAQVAQRDNVIADLQGKLAAVPLPEDPKPLDDELDGMAADADKALAASVEPSAA